jgi:LacI family transcriptional regulator
VEAALNKLTHENSSSGNRIEIQLFCESGKSFNSQIASAAEFVNRTIPGVYVAGYYSPTDELDPYEFAKKIQSEGSNSGGVVVVAREHPAINLAIRKLEKERVPVVCLTTDLPSSRRSAYVGNDQYAAGSVAAQLVGHALPKKQSAVLLVASVPYRCQQEREMGFRRVLRYEFPHLHIVEKILADEVVDTTHQLVSAHIETHGAPAAVYNVGGANRGVAQALGDYGRHGKTISVGHELNANSKELLEERTLDYVILHDVEGELSTAARWIRDNLAGLQARPATSQILVHTRYNCQL